MIGVNFLVVLFVNDGVGVIMDEIVVCSFFDDKEGCIVIWFDYDNDGLFDVVINNCVFNLFLC